MSDKPYLSYSQISMYGRCPEQYRRRYIEDERIPPGIALLTGTGFHVGAEGNFRQKIESHRNLPVSDVIDMAVAGFDERLDAGFELTPEEVSRGAQKVLGEARDQLAGLAACHAVEQAPDYQPVAVEHETRIVTTRSHDLLTITDLRDDRGRVVDLKTAARKMPQDSADKSLQLTVYATAYRVETGVDPTEVRLDVVTKTKTPARQVLTSTRGRRDYDALLARMDATLLAINAGAFPPCPSDHWVCSAKWCGYWPTCPYINAERAARSDND